MGNVNGGSKVNGATVVDGVVLGCGVVVVVLEVVVGFGVVLVLCTLEVGVFKSCEEPVLCVCSLLTGPIFTLILSPLGKVIRVEKL